MVSSRQSCDCPHCKTQHGFYTKKELKVREEYKKEFGKTKQIPFVYSKYGLEGDCRCADCVCEWNADTWKSASDLPLARSCLHQCLRSQLLAKYLLFTLNQTRNTKSMGAHKGVFVDHNRTINNVDYIMLTSQIKPT